MTVATPAAERTLSYADAIREATIQEMETDPSVVVLGLGVDDPKGIFGTTTGLAEKFGRHRVIETPLSEDAMCGAAIGMAFAGLRPIHVHIRTEFFLLTMNQFVNIAAKSLYMWGGALPVPLVSRVIVGRSWGQGAQHSQALHSLFMHIPGIRVIAPTTPYDAKGAMHWAIRDNNPVLFLEHRLIHAFQKGPVPAEPYTVGPKSRVLRKGKDVTIVGISHMAVESLRAATLLSEIGIEAEVIDPVFLSPLDMAPILDSARRTGTLLVVDNAWTNCGASSEILTRAMEAGVSFKAKRLGFAPVTCPTTKPLENLFYPSVRGIAEAAYELLKGKKPDSLPEHEVSVESVAFKGPF